MEIQKRDWALADEVVEWLENESQLDNSKPLGRTLGSVYISKILMALDTMARE